MTGKVRKEFQFNAADYQRCPVCQGLCKLPWKFPPKNFPHAMCPWCFSRGGKFLILFIQIVEALARRTCENDIHGPAMKCKCPPCTSRAVVAYRTRLTGVDQLAPIKI